MLNRFNEKALQSLDKKGRLVLPRDIRAAMRIKAGDTLFLLPIDADPSYLEIRTRKQWEQYEESLLADDGSEGKKDAYRYAMMFKAEVKVDGQGRVLINNPTREMCKLEASAAVINMKRYVEVWSQEHVRKRYPHIVRAFTRINDGKF